MRDFHRFLPLLTAVLLCGCSADKAPEAEATPPSKTVFDPLTQTMDRARGVQGTVDAQSQATRQGIEQAEGGAPAGEAPPK